MIVTKFITKNLGQTRTPAPTAAPATRSSAGPPVTNDTFEQIIQMRDQAVADIITSSPVPSRIPVTGMVSMIMQDMAPGLPQTTIMPPTWQVGANITRPTIAVNAAPSQGGASITRPTIDVVAQPTRMINVTPVRPRYVLPIYPVVAAPAVPAVATTATAEKK